MSRRVATALAIVAVVMAAAVALVAITTRSHMRLRWLSPTASPSASLGVPGPSASPTEPTGIPTGVDVTPTALAAGSCKLKAGGKADKACTPGALNPVVTQATIAQTICVANWTDTIRPPTSYTNRLKDWQIVAYGYSDRRRDAYEEDHMVPLSLGGHPRDPRNLWPEPRAVIGGSAEEKDKAENTARRDVCAGRISLADAQRRLMQAWGPA